MTGRDPPRLMRWALVASLAGATDLVAGCVLVPDRAWHSYLIALVFVATIALGLIGFLIIVHCMDATWPTLVRRLAEAGILALPVVAVLCIPLAAGLRHLYAWVDPADIAEPHVRAVLLHQRPYLNVPFFLTRGAGYLLFWSLTAVLLRRWSLAADRPGGPVARPRLRRLSAATAPAMGLTMTAAATDWIMSLAPEWVSHIFGFYFMALSVLAGTALLIVVVAACDRRGLISVSESHYHALGRCLFAFLVLWAYTQFFQFFLIWIANRPPEVRWFIERWRPGFRGASLFLILGRFALPFLALLSYRLKRNRDRLSWVAWWLLVTHWVEVHWLIAPQRRAGAAYQLTDAAALLAVGGLAVVFAVYMQRGRPMVPVGDPRLEAAVRYRSR